MSPEELILQLEAANVQDDSLFCDLICQAADTLDMDGSAFARKFGMTRSTAQRWMDRRAIPHPAMRRQIYTALANIARKRIEEGNS